MSLITNEMDDETRKKTTAISRNKNTINVNIKFSISIFFCYLHTNKQTDRHMKNMFPGTMEDHLKMIRWFGDNGDGDHLNQNLEIETRKKSEKQTQN